MSNINIKKRYSCTAEILRKRLDELMAELRKDIEFKTGWENENEFYFRTKGANGRIEIDGSYFELNLNLGIMYRSMHRTIATRIQKAIEHHIN
ncbi:MAG: polyhydroxyalkanoic acid system family protein [Kangiellaceae bacterium]|nr:polyhydroxyalkanoic acid system family protein [Kangiellaceae bacterium]